MLEERQKDILIRKERSLTFVESLIESLIKNPNEEVKKDGLIVNMGKIENILLVDIPALVSALKEETKKVDNLLGEIEGLRKVLGMAEREKDLYKKAMKVNCERFCKRVQLKKHIDLCKFKWEDCERAEFFEFDHERFGDK